jgi:nitrogen fixation protein NifU and related proteins
MDDSLRELYQEVILDHSRHPRCAGSMADPTHVKEGLNPLCGDKVKVYLKVGSDNRIESVSFEGKGCAISQASASLMSEMLSGRTVDEASILTENFLHLVRGEPADGMNEDDREALNVMAGVSEFPMRVKCATLAWHTMQSALKGGGGDE